MSKKKEIFKDAGIYSISSYLAQAFDILNGILVRRFLGPANMGIWAFLQVIQNYAKHSALGITTATARDVPYFKEKGDTAKVEEVKNLVFSFTILASILTAAGICAYALLHQPRFSPPIFYGLFAVAALIVLQRVYNLFVVLLRANKEFIFAGLLNIVSSALSVAFTFVLTWKFKLYGFYAGMISNYIVLVYFIFSKTRYRFSFSLSWKAILPLLSLGSAVLIADILRSVLVSIDRLVITKHLGFEALGIYSVALMADNYLYSLPNMFGVIFFPHFQEAFAKRDNPKDLLRYLIQPTLSIAYLFPLVIGLVWCSSDWIVRALLPQYQAGIPALKILALGSLFFALTHSFYTFLITVKKHWLLIPVHAVAVLFGFAINEFFIRRGGGIEGVAIAEGLISVFYFVLLSAVCLREIANLSETLGIYLKVSGISLYFTLILMGLDRILATKIGGGPLLFVVEYAIFLIFMLPLCRQAEKELHIFSTVKNLFLDYLKCRKKVPLEASTEALIVKNPSEKGTES